MTCYVDIDNETLKAAEETYIKQYDSTNYGLNASLRIGKSCSHNKGGKHACFVGDHHSVCIRI